ncbi:MAG: TolC family protein [Gammaproteobacteria bacterium]
MSGARFPLTTFGTVTLVLWLGGALAQDLPDPLTLEAALAHSQGLHPELLLAQARRESAEARRQLAESRYGTEVSLLARARVVEPSERGRQLHDTRNDSGIRLQLSRRLYDFGQTRARVAAADAASTGQGHHLEAVRQQRGLEVMARFLEVRLADLAFQVQDEAMAIAFVRTDRARNRHELGQMGDVELLALESTFQKVRLARHRAQNEQRNSRARLAQALARPGELSATLVQPRFPGNDRSVPELEEIEAAVQAGNPRLLALRAEVTAGRQRLAAARSGGRPVLTGILAASEFNRATSSSDDLEAELRLEIPLATGGRMGADVALARAEMQAAEAALLEAEWDLRQEVFELQQEIRVLQLQRDEVRVDTEFRDLELDQKRTEYEMEFTSDLGDAMVRFSEMRLRQARNEYELALAWARLAMLTDNPDWSPLRGGDANE